jgi:hypothetical protein
MRVIGSYNAYILGYNRQNRRFLGYFGVLLGHFEAKSREKAKKWGDSGKYGEKVPF